MASTLFRVCSFLMAAIFAYSASVQFNDPDWYLWLPLYSFACIVNVADPTSSSNSMQRMGKMAFSLGLVMFFKVVVEDYRHNIVGFWSFDMKERVVREKFGSGLVVTSMFLHHQAASSSLPNPTLCVDYGMLTLVGITYGLSFAFFAFHKAKMNF